MSSADPVTLWISQVKDGQSDAVRPLLERYFQRLVELARARLQGVPGLAAYDEDVALSAFKSLCLGAERDRFPRLADRDDLWRLLAVLTVRKAIDLQRRRRPQEAGAETVEQLLSREPPPELAAEMSEEYRRLLDRLGDPQLQAIALWKVEGHTNEEIADRLGCAVRSVERKLHRIRIEWQEAAPP
jgi:RNA polymerase sigma factor (sigma-70 family)